MNFSARGIGLAVLVAMILILAGYSIIFERNTLGFEAATREASITNTAMIQYCTDGDTQTVCNPETNMYSQSNSSTSKIYSSLIKGKRR